MNAAQIIALMTQLAGLAQTGLALVADAKVALSETDEAVLKEKLAELKAANDAAYDRVQAKLAAAAEEG